VKQVSDDYCLIGPDGLAGILARFELAGPVVGIFPLGRGRIHHTYRIRCAGSPASGYVLQRINPHVFADPAALMDNIQRVTEHLAEHARQRFADWPRRCLGLVPTRDGAGWWNDPEGVGWRVYRHIPASISHDVATEPRIAWGAAAAFGRFLRQLADLPGPRLHLTLPGFHDTPARLAALEAAVHADWHARARHTGRELDAIRKRTRLAHALAGAQAHGDLSECVVHNDTKLNNVLFDRATGEALCVVDLDTVMPGLALHDFGDLVRSAAASTGEDASAPPGIHLPLFDALVRGYLQGAGAMLQPADHAWFDIAPQIVTLELAVRFLTDHLQGDRYFNVTDPGQNLRRCRAQLTLLENLETHRQEMRRIACQAVRESPPNDHALTGDFTS
jgi:aminoglycoside phosphotransferase (APT) family kinase protein